MMKSQKLHVAFFDPERGWMEADVEESVLENEQSSQTPIQSATTPVSEQPK